MWVFPSLADTNISIYKSKVIRGNDTIFPHSFFGGFCDSPTQLVVYNNTTQFWWVYNISTQFFLVGFVTALHSWLGTITLHSFGGFNDNIVHSLGGFNDNIVHSFGEVYNISTQFFWWVL